MISISILGAYFLVPQNPPKGEAATGPLSLGYPRLAMWWPTGQSNEDISRYDMVGLANQSSLIAPLRALNPDIILLGDRATRELNYNTSSYTNSLNVTLRTTSPDWLLVQAGSTLQASLDGTNPTTKSTVTITLPSGHGARFASGDPIVIGGTPSTPFGDPNAEIARVTGVSGDTLTVSRGEFWPKAAHSVGTRISAVATSWPDSVSFDMTTQCPRATVGGVSDTWTSWNIRKAKSIYDSADWDGIIFDTHESNAANGIPGWIASRSVDQNRDNVADAVGPSSNFDTIWRAGVVAFDLAAREALGPDAILVGNGALINTYMNGAVEEGWPTYSDNTNWNLSGWKDRIINSNTYGYIKWFNSGAAAQPTVSFLEVYGPLDHSATDYRTTRYGLATALLGDGMFSREVSSWYHGNITGGALAWYDEYSVNSSGIATGDASSKGYLGQPTSAAYDANTKAAYTSSTTVYRRDYDNGISIVNPDTVAHTVTLGGTYKKIKGTQDPAINDGSTVTSITLQPKDGIILLNMDTSFYVDNKAGSNCSDAGPGSIAQPWCTLGKAATTVVAGNTVLVKGGNYQGGLTIAKSGTEAQKIIFKNYNNEAVTISGGGPAITINGSYVVIDGFKITNYSQHGVYVGSGKNYNTVKNCEISNDVGNADGSWYAGIYFVDGRGNVAESNTIHDLAVGGIHYIDSADGLISKNHIYNLQEDGIMIYGVNIKIDGNTIHDLYNLTTHTDGIVIQAPWNKTFGNVTSNITISNNTTYDINQHLYVTSWGSAGTLVDGVKLFGNVLYVSKPELGYQSGIVNDRSSAGISIQNVDIYNNTLINITSTNAQGFRWVDRGSNPGTYSNYRVKNNIFYNSRFTQEVSVNNLELDYNIHYLPSSLIRWGSTYYQTIAAFSAATGLERNGIQGDPLFINIFNGDFRIQSTSPAINAGVLDASTPLTDKDGNPRVGMPDIGAYEQQGGTSCSKSADISGDDKVNITDAAMLMAKWNDVVLSSDPIDLDCSKKIDITDATILMAHWGL